MKKTPEYKLRKLITRVNLVDLSKQFAETSVNNPISEIEVLTEGLWEHELYGEIEITPEDINLFIENFNNKARKIDIAVDQEHMPEKGAVGWFKELKKVISNGVTRLKATIEWTPVGVDMLKQSIYKYFSPEFDFEYEDPETHETVRNVLLGGALTNRPYFKSLAPVQLSENIFINESSINLQNKKGGEQIMTKEELVAKLAENEAYELPEDASEEERALLVEVKAEAEVAQKELKAEPEEGEEPETENPAENEEEGEKGEGEGEAPVQGSEVPSAKEFNQVKSELGVLRKKMRFQEIDETVRGYTFSESNPEGRLLPKSKEVAQKLLMSLTSRQGKMFDEFVKNLPKINSMMFDEMGGSSGDSVKASEELNAKVDTVAKELGITFGQALKKVSADNPELVKKALL